MPSSINQRTKAAPNAHRTTTVLRTGRATTQRHSGSKSQEALPASLAYNLEEFTQVILEGNKIELTTPGKMQYIV
jgi:hypothetical protein